MCGAVSTSLPDTVICKVSLGVVDYRTALVHRIENEVSPEAVSTAADELIRNFDNNRAYITTGSLGSLASSLVRGKLSDSSAQKALSAIISVISRENLNPGLREHAVFLLGQVLNERDEHVNEHTLGALAAACGSGVEGIANMADFAILSLSETSHSETVASLLEKEFAKAEGEAASRIESTLSLMGREVVKKKELPQLGSTIREERARARRPAPLPSGRSRARVERPPRKLGTVISGVMRAARSRR